MGEPSKVKRSATIDELEEEYSIESPILEYILLAEFDIDKGSTVRHQYPKRIGVDEGLLSEYMLPEGAHSRESDSTIFFIRENDLESDQESKTSATASSEMGAVAEDEDEQALRAKWHKKLAANANELVLSARCFIYDNMGPDWKPLDVHADTFSQLVFHSISAQDYVLEIHSSDSSLPKENSKEKRKPVLASETLLKSIPITDQLNCTVTDEENYICLDDTEGNSVAIMFSDQDNLLQFEQMVFRLLDNLKGIIPVDSLELREEELHQQYRQLQTEKNQLICLNIVRTKMDASVRRGAIVKSMAFCCRKEYIFSFKSLIMFCLNRYYELESPELAWEYLGRVFTAVNGLDLSGKPKLSHLQRKVHRATRLTLKTTEATDFKVYIEFQGAKLPIFIPFMLDEDELGCGSLRSLLHRFGEEVLTIFNGILCGNRIIFLGHNQAAESVSNYVLSACRLVSPPLSGILKRTFPYAHLTDIRFLQVEGFIAGVTNPIFQQHTEWWDILCDISTGSVVLNPVYEQQLAQIPPEELSTALDQELLDQVRSGLVMNLGEEWLQCRFRDYAQRVYDIARGRERFGSDQERLLFARANRFRVSMFVRSRLFKENRLISRWEESGSVFGRAHVEIWRDIRTLQVGKVPLKEVKRIYRDFREHVKSEEELLQFLSMLPESQGGLYPIAIGLFHESDEVKRMTIDLMNGLDLIPEGIRALNNLNYMILLTFHKNKHANVARKSIPSEEQQGKSVTPETE